ncbi:MAG: hypothetical protein N2Z84_04075 [Atribacterota bacterium]|nr:hypothetical protein [Atribacterota bacterium]
MYCPQLSPSSAAVVEEKLPVRLNLNVVGEDTIWSMHFRYAVKKKVGEIVWEQFL